MNDIQVQKVINIEALYDVLRKFSLVTSLPVTFYDQSSDFTIRPDECRNCEFCDIIQSSGIGKKRCQEFRAKSGQIAANLGDSYMGRCHTGLVEIFAPVMYGKYYLGYVVAGPLMMWEWDEMALNEFMKKTDDLQVSNAKLLSASLKIPTLESGKVKAIADLLMVVVEKVTQSGLDELKNRRELNDMQSRIADLVQEKKSNQKSIDALEKRSGTHNYPIQKERELLHKVRLGDREGANEILNDILGEIFLHNAGDMNVIKARLLELMVIISREAVEAGASMDLMLSLNHQTVTELIGINDFETMCRWIAASLEQMIDTIYETSNIKNAGTLSNIMDYIRNHYNENLTLDIVAQNVYLSPYYISHLFKEQLDITFVGYLTRIRIEESKHLLKKSSMSVASIATAVGYDDAGYFSKVFKKYTGMTPKQYKNS